MMDQYKLSVTEMQTKCKTADRGLFYQFVECEVDDWLGEVMRTVRLNPGGLLGVICAWKTISNKIYLKNKLQMEMQEKNFSN